MASFEDCCMGGGQRMWNEKEVIMNHLAKEKKRHFWGQIGWFTKLLRERTIFSQGPCVMSLMFVVQPRLCKL